MQLRALATKATAAGWTATLEMPDREDPLGGVLTVSGPDFDPVQVVNYHNPFHDLPNPAREALTRAIEFPYAEGLKVVRVEDLILLKLYAGGLRSLVDVQALLQVHPEVDRAELHARAAHFGLERELERALAG